MNKLKKIIVNLEANGKSFKIYVDKYESMEDEKNKERERERCASSFRNLRTCKKKETEMVKGDNC